MLSESLSNLNSPKAKMNERAWKRNRLKYRLAIVLFLGLAGVGIQQLNSPSTNHFQGEIITQAVERKTVPVSITANGTISPERTINLSPKSAGIIKTLLVKEGDRVRMGQTVAQMDDSGLRGQMLQMQGQLAQQEANLQRLIVGNRPEDIAKAQARLNSVQADLRQAQEDLSSNKSLYEAGAVSRQTYRKSITSVNTAQALANESEQNLALSVKGNRSEDIREARAKVIAATGSLQSIQTQLNDTNVFAPFDGVVIKKYADVGAFVSPSMAGGNGDSASSSSIVTLASDRLQVVVNISEAQIAKIKIGQSVKVKVDAFPKEIFLGKVEQIAPQATVSQNVTSFEVRLGIYGQEISKLKSGMNIEAQFEIGKLENVLLVPNAAVVRQAEGSGVYVLGSDRNPIFQAIQTGTTSGGFTEVKSGLKGNEKVLISPPPKQESESLGGIFPKPPS